MFIPIFNQMRKYPIEIITIEFVRREILFMWRVGRRNSVVGEDRSWALEFRDFFASFLSKRKGVPVEDPGLSGKATSLMKRAYTK